MDLRAYSWRKGTPIKAEWAQKFGERVDWLEGRLGHAPTSREVLEDAEVESSPIHRMFDWDDSSAAEKWRLHQSGNMLSCLVVRVEVERSGKPHKIQVPVRIVLQGHGHSHIKDVLKDPQQKQMLMEAAADSLESVRRRYEFLKELCGVFRESEKFQRIVNQRREKIKLAA